MISSASSDYTDSKIKMSFTIVERFDVAGSSRDLTIFNYLFFRRRITLGSDSLGMLDVRVFVHLLKGVSGHHLKTFHISW